MKKAWQFFQLKLFQIPLTFFISYHAFTTSINFLVSNYFFHFVFAMKSKVGNYLSVLNFYNFVCQREREFTQRVMKNHIFDKILLQIYIPLPPRFIIIIIVVRSFFCLFNSLTQSCNKLQHKNRNSFSPARPLALVITSLIQYKFSECVSKGL